MNPFDAALPAMPAQWAAPPHIHAWTTLRHTLESPDAAKRAIARALWREPVWTKQVHGAQVFDADEAGSELPLADAAVTTQINLPLVVSTADCLPVFFVSVEGDAIGVAHAGWRGLAAGVLENTAKALRAKRPAAQWLAHLGPAIGPNKFEVGADVFEAFVSSSSEARSAFADKGEGKYWCDLYALARQRLVRAGISRITGGGLCTATDSARFYSFRCDKGIVDHLRSLIWIAH